MSGIMGDDSLIPWFTSGAACKFHGWDPPTDTVDIGLDLPSPFDELATESLSVG
jgi:hypothetical protein